MRATVLELWQENAQRGPSIARCDDCGERASVARQRRARRFQCVTCFERRPTGSAVVARIVRQLRRENASAAA